AGDSWNALPVPAGVDSNIYVNMVIRGANSNLLYGSAQLHGTDASTAMGFFRSTDAGQSWSVSNPIGQTINAFDAFHRNPNIIYGHDFSPARKVHRSTDGGTTWTQLSAGFYSEPKIHPTDSLTIYYFGKNTVHKSLDGLQTVATVYTDPTLDSTRQMVDIKISLSNPNVVWAAAKGYYLYRTTNAGFSWTKITAIRDSVYGGPTKVEETTDMSPKEFGLEQNYPNPFNGSTVIRFRIARMEFVKLSVYDLTGKLMKVLVSGTLSANSYQVLWDGTNESGQALPSGVYVYRIVAGSFVESKKLTVIK
ncbi:MAG: T9SS type A sorting domain-containing protein, partial [Bacteroidota bacterium]